jgi:C1A family cysteine protease
MSENPTLEQILARPTRKYNLIINRLPKKEFKLLKVNIPILLPEIVDLRSKFPPIFNQGELGSCTANALCGVIGYDLPDFIGSRLFLYYNERKLEDTIPDDSGASLTDGVRCLLKYGICPETDWPYNISLFTTTPPNNCYENASKHKAIEVKHINNNLNSMKTSLAKGYPFVVGILLYESFEESAVSSTGIVQMPNTETEELLGGHAVVCVGYNDTKKVWIMRNSWGTGWGDQGYFYLPYKYLIDSSLTSDLWSVIKMS